MRIWDCKIWSWFLRFPEPVLRYLHLSDQYSDCRVFWNYDFPWISKNYFSPPTRGYLIFGSVTVPATFGAKNKPCGNLLHATTRRVRDILSKTSSDLVSFRNFHDSEFQFTSYFFVKIDSPATSKQWHAGDIGDKDCDIGDKIETSHKITNVCAL